MSEPHLLTPAPPPLTPTAGPVPLTIQRIQAWVWARYVQFEAAPFPMDEDEALTLLERHYREAPMAADAECFYYGILAYERSFARPHRRRHCLRQALEAFDAYRRQTSEGFAWAPVEDRRTHLVDELWPALEQTAGVALD
jgi:hypothetical protein